MSMRREFDILLLLYILSNNQLLCLSLLDSKSKTETPNDKASSKFPILDKWNQWKRWNEINASHSILKLLQCASFRSNRHYWAQIIRSSWNSNPEFLLHVYLHSMFHVFFRLHFNCLRQFPQFWSTKWCIFPTLLSSWWNPLKMMTSK